MPIKYVISDRTIILTEKTSNDPSAGSPYGNHVTTFPSSPHYNLKASTITHVVNIISNIETKTQAYTQTLRQKHRNTQKHNDIQ